MHEQAGSTTFSAKKFDTNRSEPSDSGPVICLGLTFPSDDERRKHFLEKLRDKLKDPEFRKIEGFPIGLDDDILALSDPPYYTACPNPFITDFFKHYGKPYDSNKPYSREPFAADVSEGKNDPSYNAHSYHTKVPHKAIMRYILHYTEPGVKEFEEYRTSVQKRLKVFRLEAVRAGFKKAWQERDYAAIVTVASKIPENILNEDPKLLMWYDQAITRTGE